jgi:hypothetical protein
LEELEEVIGRYDREEADVMCALQGYSKALGDI